MRDGIIHRKRGVGTVVSEVNGEMITFELDGNFQRLRNSAAKLPLDVEVLEITTTSCPSRVQQILSIDPEKAVWRMRKIRKYRVD